MYHPEQFLASRCPAEMKTLVALLVCVLAWPAWSGADVSPYAGQEAREVKALSQDEVDDLLAGRGMGYAKAAELNGYPGPLHVLELADRLDLSADQRTRTQQIYDVMNASARALGAELLAAERLLETMFATRQVDPESLRSALGHSADVQAQLRNVHLAAHLRQIEVLTPAQVERYVELRGYTQGHQHHQGGDR